ncbi:unnamed protein product [Pleuronectes platessa]|uniref:Uncharacterized protein n=1 Tax=Pleuronectes platessa TaxID=8262 RepID=A0A9N7VN05_PLEPL|nr:unnamed protein product [Pleuronectes platessa]
MKRPQPFTSTGENLPSSIILSDDRNYILNSANSSSLQDEGGQATDGTATVLCSFVQVVDFCSCTTLQTGRDGPEMDGSEEEARESGTAVNQRDNVPDIDVLSPEELWRLDRQRDDKERGTDGARK